MTSDPCDRVKQRPQVACPLYYSRGFFFAHMGEAKLLTSNSIPTENKPLFGYDICVAKYSLFWLETCDECRKRRLTVEWKEKVDRVPNRVAFIDVNGPLAVF